MQDQGRTRRDFVKASAATGAAALLAGVGFNRMASAQDTSELITQVVTFSFKPEKKEEAVKALAELAKAVEDNEPEVLAYIPQNQQFHMPQLFQRLLAMNKCISAFHISEDWIDIGRVEDFHRASSLPSWLRESRD